jgi:hypothetical protein
LQTDSQVSEAELLAALRARLPERATVGACTTGTAMTARWQVTIEMLSDGAVQLRVDAEAVSLTHRLPVSTLNRNDRSRLLALSIVEAVRPALDALLPRLHESPAGQVDMEATLARLAPPDELEVDRPLDAADANSLHTDSESQAPPPPPPPPPPPSPSPHWRGIVAVGTRLSLDELRLAPSALIAAEAPLGPLTLAAHLGADLLPVSKVAALQISGTQADGGLAVLLDGDTLELSLGAQARYSRFSVTGDDAALSRHVVTAWSWGAFATVGWWPWRGSCWHVGALVGTALWWQPLRLRLGGEPITRQSFVEATIAPAARFACF